MRATIEVTAHEQGDADWAFRNGGADELPADKVSAGMGNDLDSLRNFDVDTDTTTRIMGNRGTSTQHNKCVLTRAGT